MTPMIKVESIRKTETMQILTATGKKIPVGRDRMQPYLRTKRDGTKGAQKCTTEKTIVDVVGHGITRKRNVITRTPTAMKMGGISSPLPKVGNGGRTKRSDRSYIDR